MRKCCCTSSEFKGINGASIKMTMLSPLLLHGYNAFIIDTPLSLSFGDSPNPNLTEIYP